MFARICAGILTLLLIIAGPWWLAWVACVIGIVGFRSPWEYLFFALFSDLLYGVPRGGVLLPWSLTASVLAFVLILCREWLVTVIRTPEWL